MQTAFYISTTIDLWPGWVAALNGYLFDGAVGVGVGDYLEMSTPEKAEAYAGGKLYHFVGPDG